MGRDPVVRDLVGLLRRPEIDGEIGPVLVYPTVARIVRSEQRRR